MTTILKALLGCFFVAMSCASLRADDWPQWLGPQRDAVWRETGIIEKFAPGGPPIRWRVPIGAGYSSPTVAGGKVYLFDHTLSEGTTRPSNPFARNTTPGFERVTCVDAASGAVVWKQQYECAYGMSYNAGPRSAPLVDADRLYTFGAEGDLQCRKTADGSLLWQKHLGGEHTPMWGFAASPLVEGDKLIVIGADPAGIVLTYNKLTGDPLWQSLPAKEPGYSSPIVIEAGGVRQLIVWNPQALSSLDLKTGKLYWTEPMECKAGMSIATPKRVGDLLFVSAFYNGSMMMKLDPQKPAASKLWKIGGVSERKTESLHAVLCTPVIDDSHIYGVCSYGQLRGLDALTGKRLWETFAATSADAGQVRWANAFIVANADRHFLFNETGDLIIAKFTPQGYQELSRAHLLDPINTDPGRPVVWSQPAFANRCIYARNDKELLCASLAAAR